MLSVLCFLHLHGSTPHIPPDMAAILRTSMKAPARIRRKTAILAPLEGVSDVGYRAVCHSLGAAFTWTEMVRAVAVCRRERATLDLIDTKDPATPTGVQLMAKSAEELMAALATLEDLAATSPAAGGADTAPR